MVADKVADKVSKEVAKEVAKEVVGRCSLFRPSLMTSRFHFVGKLHQRYVRCAPCVFEFSFQRAHLKVWWYNGVHT